MMADGTRPDHFTLPLVIRAISTFPAWLQLGKAIHSLSIHLGFCGNPYLCNSLIDFYCRFKAVSDARKLFDEMRDPDVVSWTTLISGYIHSGNILESARLLQQMRISGIEPNSVTLAAVLPITHAVRRNAEGVRQLHGFAVKRGLLGHELARNSISTAYSKLDSSEEAEKLFDFVEKRSSVSWNVLMLAYFSSGNLFRAAECFKKMMAGSCPASPETLTLLFSALGKLRDLRMGHQIHCYAVKNGKIDSVLQSSLVDFYTRCADPSSSFSLIQESGKNGDQISWIVMMRALVQNGRFREAINLFWRMQKPGFEPNAESLRCLAAAFAHSSALLPGKMIHGYSIRHPQANSEPEAESLGASILNMYAKCGDIVLARRFFDNMVCRDVVSWSSMIEGYAVQGMGSEAIELFHRMQAAGVNPNGVTFLSLLSSCSHGGLVEEACQLFSSMDREFGMKAELSHYTCMVDLLGRAGKLSEALDLIRLMDVKPDGRVWGALLASCRVHQNTDIGDYAARRLFELEPENAGYRIVYSSIQAGKDQWAEAERVWEVVDGLELKRRPGWSCLEEKGGFCLFVAANCSHRRAEDIYETLRCLGRIAEGIHCLGTGIA